MGYVDGMSMYAAYFVPTGVDPTGMGCQCGEAFTAICAVGPIDAYTANELANEASAAARATGLPGIRNGQADAFRHCFWSCRMAQQIGSDQAKKIGDIHEECRSGPAGETAMDLANNASGRALGVPGADCSAGCLGAVAAGSLVTTPPVGATTGTVYYY